MGFNYLEFFYICISYINPMMLHRLPFLFFLFSLFIFSSCEYKLKGDYFRDLNANPPANVLITITGHSDTLVATSNQSYYVHVSCGNRTVLFYRLYIDGVQKNFENVTSNNFYIEPMTYTDLDGVYRMTVEAGINTGSGSIGDILGTEGDRKSTRLNSSHANISY